MRVNGFASGQHLHKLLDAPGPGLGLLRALDPIEDGIPVRTSERLKHGLGIGIGFQGARQVLWNPRTSLSGVGGLPSTVRLRLTNLVLS